MSKFKVFWGRLALLLVYLGGMAALIYFVSPYLGWSPWLAQPVYFTIVYLVGTLIFFLFGRRRKFFYLEDSLRELCIFSLQGLFIGGVIFLSQQLFLVPVTAWWVGPLLFPLYRSGWLTLRKEKRRN